MAKFRMLAPAWFRSAPLLLTMLALMAGIVGMHVWTGGHGTTAPAQGSEHSAMSGHDGGSSGGVGAPMSPLPHESRGGPALHDGGNFPAEMTGAATVQASSGAASIPTDVSTVCSEGCGEMVMLNCVLALALLILIVLIRPALFPLRRLGSLFRPIPMLLQTVAPIRSPSLVHLSISRT